MVLTSIPMKTAYSVCLIDIIANQVASEWELGEAVYSAYIPSSAEGVQLDNIASINGVTRLGAAASTCPVTLYGQINTTIPINTIVEAPLSHDKFGTKAAATLDPSTACSYLEVECPTPTGASESFTMDIAGITLTVTSETTAIGVATALQAAIVAESGLDNICQSTRTDAVVSITAYNGTDLGVSTFASTVTTPLSIIKTGMFINCEATVTGRISAPLNTITKVVTPVGDVDSNCTNFEVAIVGRKYETDTELRLRRLQTVTTAGASTVDAITSNLLQVDDVSYVRVTDNVTLITDANGIPGKAFLAVVQGGSNTSIGQKIWDVKPAGIQAYGDIDVTVQDIQGDSHTVSFSRPTAVPITVDIEYSKNPEEDFPVGGEEAIKEVVVTYGNKLGIGEDVIAQKFFGPIYLGVSGIDNLTITVSIPTASYVNLAAFPLVGEDNKIYVALDTGKNYRWDGAAYVEVTPPTGAIISIDADEYSTFSEAAITVAEV